MSALARLRAPQLASEDVSAPIPAAFRLASGDALGDDAVSVRLQGALHAPVVAVLGGISAGRCVAGDQGWWNEVVSPGGGVDLDRYCVLGLDFAPLGDRRVRITPDDQARLIEVALDHLGVAALHAFVGSSYGAMVGMALAQRAPERVRRRDRCIAAVVGGTLQLGADALSRPDLHPRPRPAAATTGTGPPLLQSGSACPETAGSSLSCIQPVDRADRSRGGRSLL